MAFYMLTTFLALQNTTPDTEGTGTLIALGVVIILITIIAAIALNVYARRREQQATTTEQYRPDPPEDITLWSMYTLLHPAPTYTPEQQARALVATLFHMVHQRVMTIETDGTGNPDAMTLRLTGAEHAAPGLEQALLRAIFPQNEPARSLSDSADTVQEQLPHLYQQLAATAQHDTLFEPGGVAKREVWQTAGGLILGLAVLVPLLIMVFVAFARIELSSLWMARLFLLLPSVVALVGVLVFARSWFIRSKTPAGTQAAAQCHAFRRYMEDIERADDTIQVLATWEHALPYAIVSGVEKPFIIGLATRGAQAPSWYVMHHRASSDLRQQMLGENYVHSLREVGSSLLGLIQMLMFVFSSEINQKSTTPGKTEDAHADRAAADQEAQVSDTSSASHDIRDSVGHDNSRHSSTPTTVVESDMGQTANAADDD